MSIADNVLNEALRYHGLGLSVIPIPMNEKLPQIKWKPYQSKRADVATIRRWYGKEPQNIAILGGEISNGLGVRDFDSHDSYLAWEAEHPELAKTLPTVATSRGFHVWARFSPVPRFQEFHDGELRTAGHYVIAPPSVHPNGTAYSWQNPLNGEIPLLTLENSGFATDYKGCNTDNTEHTDNSGEHSQLREHKRTQITHDVIGTSELVSAKSEQVLIRQAIDRTIVQTFSTRHRCLFNLARELKAIPGSDSWTADRLHRILTAWHSKSLTNIKTKEFEFSWFDFLETWDKVKCPIGRGCVDNALEAARNAPTPNCAKQYEKNEPLVLLVKFCRELQHLHVSVDGNQPFFLTARKAAEVLGTDDQVRAWRCLKGFTLEKPPILKLVSSGSQASRKANEYLYLGD